MKGYARLNDVLGRLNDISAGKITVGDLLTIVEAKAASCAYPPMWESDADRWAERLKQILIRAATRLPEGESSAPGPRQTENDLVRSGPLGWERILDDAQSAMRRHRAKGRELRRSIKTIEAKIEAGEPCPDY
jgi:hypothetical protein